MRSFWSQIFIGSIVPSYSSVVDYFATVATCSPDSCYKNRNTGTMSSALRQCLPLSLCEPDQPWTFHQQALSSTKPHQIPVQLVLAGGRCVCGQPTTEVWKPSAEGDGGAAAAGTDGLGGAAAEPATVAENEIFLIYTGMPASPTLQPILLKKGLAFVSVAVTQAVVGVSILSGYSFSDLQPDGTDTV